MNLSGIVLVLLILALIVKIYQDRSQSGGALPQVTITDKYTEPYYSRQYRELDDVNNVLNRPLTEKKENIDTLQTFNSICDLDGHCPEQFNMKEPIRRYLDFTDIISTPAKKDTKVLVEDKQPYFLDEALIIDYYGKKFYYDASYPKQPISVEFAKDPAKFVREHPNDYPSYVIASRNYSILKDNDPYNP